MRNFLTSLFFLFTLSSFSQKEGKVINYNDGWQKGKHIFVDGDWKPHGKWRHQYGKAMYDKGKLVWIEVNGLDRVSYETIRLKQLENKIERLETELASN
jgi:hypothetical protein